MEERKYDVEATASAVMSVVRRGDLSGLSPEEKTRYLIALCDSLGLNPMTQPIQFLRFQGREIAYVTRGATDQLAARAGLSRTIIEGPDVRDYGGIKLVYCKAEGRLPNGRVDASIATIRGAIDENILMKAESKAKRRVTLSILGLGMLTEDEAEDMDAGQSLTAAPRKPVKRAASSQEVAVSFGHSVTSDEATGEYLDTAVAVIRESFEEKPEDLARELAALFLRHEKLPSVNADALFSRLKDAAKLHGAATVFQRAVQSAVSADAASVRERLSREAAHVTSPAAPPETIPASDPMEALLESLSVADNPYSLAGILLHDAPKDASPDQKKRLFVAACKRLAEIRAEAGVPTDAASVSASMRAVIDEHKAIEEERKRVRDKARDAFEEGTEPYVEPAAAPQAQQPSEDAQWRQHLAEKGEDDGAIAGAFAKRATEFSAAGVYEERLAATVEAVDRARKRGSIDAATFVRDVLANASKRRPRKPMA